MNHKDQDTINESLKMIEDSGVKVGNIYRHYKTKNLYQVIGTSINEPDLEPLVHYREFVLDFAQAPREPGVTWTRYLNIFCGQVAVKGVFVSRFAREKS